MDESLYQLALSHYQKGNYENAYHIFNDYLQTPENGLSQKESLLYEECKKQIQNKYLLLINEYIQQGNWEHAKETQKHYIEEFGSDPKIEGIKIQVPKASSAEVINYQSEINNVTANYRAWIPIVIIITIIVAIVYIARKVIIEKPNNPEMTERALASAVKEAAEQSNKFEYINEKRGNYSVNIEWPLSLIGLSDISWVQLAIIRNAFDSNNVDIHSCVESYFKKSSEAESLGMSEPSGELEIKFENRINNLYVYNVFRHADLGGGTGASSIYETEHIYLDAVSKSEIKSDEFFTDPVRTLTLVNKHISLNEYHSKADKLPDDCRISDTGVTFIFPKYGIGYGYQSNVEISLTYGELESVMSEKLKKALGYQPTGYAKRVDLSRKKDKETPIYLSCKGDMVGYPIEMNISINGDGSIKGEYNNVKYDVHFSLDGYVEASDSLRIVGYHEDAKFYFTLYRMGEYGKIVGYGSNGKNRLDINLNSEERIHPDNVSFLTYKLVDGCTLSYPSFFQKTEVVNGNRVFTDNKTAAITVFIKQSTETVENLYNEIKSKSPVYSRLKDNWVVVSDYDDNGNIYYMKLVKKHNEYFVANLVFQSKEKDYYSNIIPKIFNKFPD